MKAASTHAFNSVIALAMFFCSFVPDSEASDVRSIRVLLVGNSFSYWNKLPEVLQEYITRYYPRVDVKVEALTADGASIQERISDPAVREKIATEQWTHIVIQGRHGMNWRFDGKQKWSSPDEFVESASIGVQALGRKDSTLILFEPWTSDSKSSAFCRLWIP